LVLATIMSATGSSTCRFDLFHCGLRLDTTVDLISAAVYKSSWGRAFEDNWGGRKTTYNAIKKPVDILEGILRTELGVAAADINTGSFDTAAGLRTGSSWEGVALQLLEQVSSEDLLDAFCRQFGLLFYTALDGRDSVAALDYSATVAGWVTEADLVAEPVVGLTSRDLLYTDFRVNYANPPGTDLYLATAYCNRTNHNLSADGTAYSSKCSTAYTDAGQVERQLELDCPFINSQATAEVVLKWWIDWTRKQRRWAKLVLPMDALKYELGDRLDLDLGDVLPTVEQTSPSRPVWVVYRSTVRTTGRVELEVLEVVAP
jgi:hypothetical protein